MPEAGGFGPDARLGSRRDFRRVFTDGKKCVGRRIILWSLSPAGVPSARLGLSVPAKIGKAVLRNRLKRLMRECFRLSRARLEPGDLVVYLRPGCRWAGLAEAQRDFMELARQAGVLKP
jgi:ribonuclease P protein component